MEFPEFKNDYINEFGIMYHQDYWDKDGEILIGTNHQDHFQLNARDLTVHTFKGADNVEGSKYSDTIYSHGDDNISGGRGDDFISSKRGSAVIDAGSGSDTVKINITNHGFDTIDLGRGKDNLIIKLTRKVNKGGFLVNDLHAEDEFKFTGKNLDRLTARDHGHAIEYFIRNKHIGTFMNYSDVVHHQLAHDIKETGFDELTYLNGPNLDTYKKDKFKKNATKARMSMMSDMFEQIAIGNDLVKNYKQLQENPDEFNKALEVIVVNEFDSSLSEQAMRVGGEISKNYDSMVDLYEGIKAAIGAEI